MADLTAARSLLNKVKDEMDILDDELPLVQGSIVTVLEELAERVLNVPTFIDDNTDWEKAYSLAYRDVSKWIKILANQVAQV